MTIKVAPYGYSGTLTTGGGVMLINGVLHEAVRPVSQGESLWVPVRTYTGPVQEVDDRGRPMPVAPAPENRADG